MTAGGKVGGGLDFGNSAVSARSFKLAILF